MRIASCGLWLSCAGALLAAAAAPETPKAEKSTKAPAKAAAPSRTLIKPLALELALIGKLAGPAKTAPKELLERAQYLKRFAGAGYGIRAIVNNSEAASTQRAQRQTAYLALTEAHIQAAAGRVDEFEKREHIKVKPGKTAASRQDRAYPILVKEAGVKELIDLAQAIVDSSSGTPPSARDAAVLRAQREQAQKRVALLRTLKEAIAVYTTAVHVYDAFADDLRATAKKDALAERVAALKTQAESLAANNKGVVKAEAAGTQQMRIAVTPEKRDAIQAALKERLGKDRKSKDTDFIDGPIDFLPLPWPLSAKITPRGDFHITEFVCGEELFLTVYETTGLWYRIVALELDDVRYVATAHREIPHEEAR